MVLDYEVKEVREPVQLEHERTVEECSCWSLYGNADRLPHVLTEHLAILDALDDGAAEEAVRRLEYHLDRIFEMIEQEPAAYRPYVVE